MEGRRPSRVPSNFSSVRRAASTGAARPVPTTAIARIGHSAGRRLAMSSSIRPLSDVPMKYAGSAPSVRSTEAICRRMSRR